jgi:protein translocase SecG subunit
MMWIIGILTVFLVLDCLFLMLLVLVQLPKKEAGMGQAFGGAATDALFGAGSGNALTKMTKYATVIFFVFTLILSILNAKAARKKGTLESTLQAVKEAPATLPPGPVKSTDSGVVPTNIQGKTPSAPTTNAGAPPALAPDTNKLLTPNPAPAEKK